MEKQLLHITVNSEYHELYIKPKRLLVEAKEALATHSDLSHTAFLRDAQKEFAEGMITLAQPLQMFGAGAQ